MKYQIVLQWAGSAITAYDVMISVEEALIGELRNGSEVDGHDAGVGEFNIFIRTDEPQRTFEIVKSVLEDQNMLENVRAAYREATEEAKYNILWPQDLKEFAVA